MLDGGCFYPPTDYTKWADLISAWAMHANGRYPKVAASWLWELWNEPDIGYWNGTFADYAKLYDYTESALHAAIPDAALGGPAVASAGSTFLTQFLQHCATGTNAVTGTDRDAPRSRDLPRERRRRHRGGHVEMDLGNQLRLHRAGFNAVAGDPPVQADAHLRHRGGSRRLRGLLGEQQPGRRLPHLARLRRVRDGDDEAQPRARGRGGRQAGRPADLGVHVSRHALLRRVPRPRHQRHQHARAGRVRAAGAPRRDALAPHQQRGARRSTTSSPTACAASRTSTAWRR